MPAPSDASRSADAVRRESRRRRATGLLLILPAVVLGALSFEEWRLGAETERQFALRAVTSDAALRLGSAIVTVRVALDAARPDREPTVAIRVNGKPVVEDVPGRVGAYVVERRSDGWRRLVVAQNVSRRFGDAAGTGPVSRLIWIDADGRAVEEIVRATDWFRSPLSTRLMRYVVPDNLGYRSNVLWAGSEPPILKVVGGLSFFGLAMLLRRRRPAGAHD